MVMMKSWNKNQPKLEFIALEIEMAIISAGDANGGDGRSLDK